ncbi:MAG TPA: hypothetical protein VEC11_12955 [Allosphingosinicella sp.]|nr:hypothetical protein [Allosphingosinicella sp.]
MLKLLLALLLALPAQAPETFEHARYQEGQVWEYRTRPGDEGSLLKIQRIEGWPQGHGSVYHISVIGVRLGGQTGTIQHLPVSELTLNASVTRLSPSTAIFPSPDEGISLWREAQGGVFDLPLAEIIAIAAQQIGGPPEPAPGT